jgi:hypothetical protein
MHNAVCFELGTNIRKYFNLLRRSELYILSPTYIGVEEKNIIFLGVCISRDLYYV